MAPDISADTGLGASGWALGSHTWKGTTPAFDPKPTRASRKTSRAHAGREVPGVDRQSGEGSDRRSGRPGPGSREDQGGADVGEHRVPGARAACRLAAAVVDEHQGE